MSKLFPRIKVNSVDSYFALPRNEREKFGVYLSPSSLPWDGFEEFLNKGGQGWGALEKRIAEEYPIQYFVRNMWENLDIYFSRFRGKLETWWIWAFNPQHSELRAVISRNWDDLDNIIRKFLFACVVSYVEKEDGLRNLVLMRETKTKQLKLKSRKISKEERAAIRTELEGWGGEKEFNRYYDMNYADNELIEETYNYITKVRPSYQMFWDEGAGMTTKEGKSLTWSQLDILLDKTDDYYIRAIIDYRKYLWS